MASLRSRFAAVVAAGERCELGRAALEIARIAYPELEPERYLIMLDDLAAAIRPRLEPGTPAEAKLEVMTHYLFEECGFRGNQDDYYDPSNSYLNDVLDRRVGIPISLAVLMIEVGARLGLLVEGVGFPGHFLVRVPTSQGAVLLDPFFRGRPVKDEDLLERLQNLSSGATPTGPEFEHVPPEFLLATSRPSILARMLRNLLRVYLDKKDAEHALAAVDLLLVLIPEAPDELKTRAFLYEQLECFAAAADDLRRYLELSPGAADADEVRGRLSRLSDEAPTLH